jgi:hypothetical protein
MASRFAAWRGDAIACQGRGRGLKQAGPSGSRRIVVDRGKSRLIELYRGCIVQYSLQKLGLERLTDVITYLSRTAASQHLVSTVWVDVLLDLHKYLLDAQEKTLARIVRAGGEPPDAFF